MTTETEFFKVPFTDVVDLVRKRAVYIQKGFAYVSQVSYLSWVFSLEVKDVKLSIGNAFLVARFLLVFG